MASHNSLSSKFYLVTGASRGIGFETAKELACRSASVIMLCRNPDRAESARMAIQTEAGHNRVHAVIADLECLSSIAHARQSVEQWTSRLDGLINNAGAYFSGRQLTSHQMERHFVVNHLAYIVIAENFKTMLNGGGRLVNVASAAHWAGDIHFDELSGTEGVGGFLAYAQSKLANILFSRYLAKAWRDEGITVNAVHPGTVKSNFALETSVFLGKLMKLGAPFLTTPKKAAENSVYVATSPELEGVSGEYFTRKKIDWLSPRAKNDLMAERLMTVSRAMIEEALHLESGI